MYDEPRRRAVQIAEQQMRELNAKLKGKKSVRSDSDDSSDEEEEEEEEEIEEEEEDEEYVKSPESKRTHEDVIDKQPKVLLKKPSEEIMEKLSASEHEQSIIEEEEESVVEDDSEDEQIQLPLKKKLRDAFGEDEEEEDEQQVKGEVEEEANGEDLISSFIMLEHSYFFKSPSSDDKVDGKDDETGIITDAKPDKYIGKDLDSILDTKDLFKKDLVKHRFNMRSNLEETTLIWNIINEGVDAEDLVYLKEAFDSLVHIGAKEVETLSWVDHPCIFFKVYFCFVFNYLRLFWVSYLT